MVMQQDRPAVSFAGTAEEQRVAATVLEAVRARARFMSVDAPVRVSQSSLTEFLGRDGGPIAELVDRAIAANPGVFAVEEINGERVVVTSRVGHVPHGVVNVLDHSFVRRFMTPQPKPERPAQPVRERARVDPSWATLASVLGELAAAREPEPELEAEPEPEEVAPAATAAVEPVAIVEPETQPEPEPEVIVEVAPARTITVPATMPTDVGQIEDVDLAEAITVRLRADLRVANFGEQWMTEDRVPRFSRGDLRRLKEYIQEQEQPLTDDVLVQDVLAVRPAAPDFDLMRFAVNFRLSREHREFDFVGTANQRFWSTSSLPQIGTTRRKPNEIGTDYRYLLDEVAESPKPRSLKSLDHVLTFYEYAHGLLPYDAEMQALLPAPVLPNQRSAVLTFECPQSYTTYLVELRFPTPNRGGFILGLDDFYTENLVPGAMISVSRTDNDGHYLVEYLATGSQQARLLEMDERRAQRYVFRPTTYSCGVADEFLLTEERFPRLASEKPLDEKIRRRPESVVAATFERVGEPSHPGFWATFGDLLAAANIERPFSEHLLRTVLEQDETGAFARDSDGTDAYTYVPGTTS